MSHSFTPTDTERACGVTLQDVTTTRIRGYVTADGRTFVAGSGMSPAVSMPAAPTRRTYRARRIARRFFEYTADGITPSDDVEDFNVDGEPYATDDDVHTFDSVADMVAAIRRDYVSFAAYGDGMTASDPDGSQIIDYATGAREAVSWHIDDVPAALLARVIIPAVDAR